MTDLANSRPVRVAFAGGGTTGHIGPMIAMARALQELQPDAHIVMIGTDDGLETTLVPDAGFTLETIDKVPFPRSLNTDLFTMPFRLRKAIKDTRAILTEHEIDVVVGVGGYASTPAYLAARKEKLPIIVHEANVRPGMANKLGARYATVVATAFPDTELPNAQWVGMPLRPEVAQLGTGPTLRAQARATLGLDPDRTTLIVTGGSSGALNLNNTIAEVIEDLTATGAQILHLTGRDKSVTNEAGNLIEVPGYHQAEYIDGLERVYQAADLVLARSGAGTVCEIAAVGIASVLVPLPIGNGEQSLNAQGLVEAGAAVMIPDEQFTPEWARGRLPELLADPARLDFMASAAAKLGRKDAATTMAQHIIDAGRAHQTK